MSSKVIAKYGLKWRKVNVVCVSNSAIHKADGLMVPSRSMILTGTILVEQKSVHWLSMGAASRNSLWGAFLPVFFWERLVTKEPAAL